MAKRTVAQIRRDIAGLVLAAQREAEDLTRREEKNEPDALASMERASAVGLCEGLRMALEVIDRQ